MPARQRKPKLDRAAGVVPVAEEEPAPTVPKYLMDPRKRPRQIWDFAQAVLLIYVGIMSPFRIGFMVPVEPFSTWCARMFVYSACCGPLRWGDCYQCTRLIAVHCCCRFWIELLMDVYFIADLCLNFRTCYVRDDGNLETDTMKIATHYLRGWYVLDVLWAAPPPLPPSLIPSLPPCLPPSLPPSPSLPLFDMLTDWRWRSSGLRSISFRRFRCSTL